jgi:hypothetical protein
MRSVARLLGQALEQAFALHRGPHGWAPLEVVKGWLRWVSHHTGLPVILVAAIALVVSWRLVRHTARFAVQVLLTLLALLVATRLGLIRW